uniref:Uncharacterized protein n=1 Tax=Oryza rufipogon TaxID=4529 RepID=A0A0E0Q7F5_ORYRU
MPMGHMRCATAWCSARHSSELIKELAAVAVIPGGGIGAGLWQRRLLAEEEALRAPEEETFPGGFLRSVAVPDEGIGVELRRRRFPAEESALRAPKAATFPGEASGTVASSWRGPCPHTAPPLSSPRALRPLVTPPLADRLACRRREKGEGVEER